MTYGDFIEELRPLRDTAAGLLGNRLRSKSPEHKLWCAAATDLFARIWLEGFGPVIVRSGIVSRSFEDGWVDRSTSQLMLQRRYDEEIQKTIIEFDLILKNFDKYGAPKAPQRVSSKAQAASSNEAMSIKPEVRSPHEVDPHSNVTVVWLAKNVPAGLWLRAVAGVLTLIGAAFIFGLRCGSSDPGKRFQQVVDPSFTGQHYQGSEQARPDSMRSPPTDSLIGSNVRGR